MTNPSDGTLSSNIVFDRSGAYMPHENPIWYINCAAQSYRSMPTLHINIRGYVLQMKQYFQFPSQNTIAWIGIAKRCDVWECMWWVWHVHMRQANACMMHRIEHMWQYHTHTTSTIHLFTNFAGVAIATRRNILLTVSEQHITFSIPLLSLSRCSLFIFLTMSLMHTINKHTVFNSNSAQLVKDRLFYIKKTSFYVRCVYNIETTSKRLLC